MKSVKFLKTIIEYKIEIFILNKNKQMRLYQRLFPFLNQWVFILLNFIFLIVWASLLLLGARECSGKIGCNVFEDPLFLVGLIFGFIQWCIFIFGFTAINTQSEEDIIVE